MKDDILKDYLYEDDWGWDFCKYCNSCCGGYEGEQHIKDCKIAIAKTKRGIDDFRII